MHQRLLILTADQGRVNPVALEHKKLHLIAPRSHICPLFFGTRPWIGKGLRPDLIGARCLEAFRNHYARNRDFPQSCP
jgi:hypothetical protein